MLYSMTAVESVRFNGIIYRRYPEAKNHTERAYFIPGIADKRRGFGRLHEEIWKAAYGPVPDGHDIHHRDGDSLNNDLSNLQVLTKSEHQKIHTEQRRVSGSYSTPEKLAHLERIRPLTKLWHASEEGRAWHAAGGRASWEGREHRLIKCQRCGADYLSRTVGMTLYCSGNCRSAARRAAGTDKVERSCAVCSGSFMVNRYAKTATCSRRCSMVWRARSER